VQEPIGHRDAQGTTADVGLQRSCTRALWETFLGDQQANTILAEIACLSRNLDV
jgi:hypothetical protein